MNINKLRLISKIDFQQFFILCLATFLSRALGPSVGPLLLFFTAMFLLATYQSVHFAIFNLSILGTLAIGLAPLYLVARGLIFDGALTVFDYQIYIILFFFLCRSIQTGMYQKKSKTVISFDNVRMIASLSGLFILLILQRILDKRSPGDSVAWVTSGDSKNHFVNAYNINSIGSLKIEAFIVQPSSSPSLLSLFLSQVDSDLDTISSFLPTLMNIYAYVWVVLLGILGVTFSATLTIFWKYIGKQNSATPVALIAIAGLTPLLSYILGPTLIDGFFTAIFGIVTTTAVINWSLKMILEKNNKYSQIALGVILFLCSLFAWTFIGFFTFLIFVITTRQILINRGSSSSLVNTAIVVSGSFSVLLVHFSTAGQDAIKRAKSALTATGAISATSPYFLYSIFAFLIIFSIIYSKKSIISFALQSISVSGFVSLHLFKFFSNLGFQGWNYYLIKFQWMLFAGLTSILFSLVLIYSYPSNRGRFLLTKSLALALVFVATHFVSESIVSTNKVIPKMLRGWENPRALTMNKVFEQEIDRKNPTMFFHYGYGGDARLANFWLTAFSDPVEPLKGWNYTIDPTGDVKQLCEVNAYYPEVTIVTSDLKLEEQLVSNCPDQVFIIRLVPPIV